MMHTTEMRQKDIVHMSKRNNKGSQDDFFKRWIHTIVVLSFTFMLYFVSLSNGYNMDDELVTINHRLTSQGLSALPAIFTSPYYQDAMGYSYEYRPMVLASFAIEHQFFGESPFVSHFFNLLLYVLLGVLFFKVMVRLLYSYSVVVSLALTLLFVAHTSHTEVVCSIKNRDELLALLFGLLTLRAALLFVGGNKWQLGAVVLFYTAALMSKVTIMSFVFIIPLLLLFFSSISFLQYVLLLLGFLVPTHFFITNTGHLQKHLFYTAAISGLPLLFFAFDRSSAIYTGLVAWLKSLRHDAVSELRVFINVSDVVVLPSWDEFKIGLKVYSLGYASMTIGLLSLFAGGIYFNYKWISIIAIILTAVSYGYISQARYSFWLLFFVAGLLLFGAYYYPLQHTNFLILGGAFFLFRSFDNKHHSSFYLLIAFVFAAAQAITEGEFTIFMCFLFLGLNRYAWTKYLHLLLSVFFTGYVVYTLAILKNLYYLQAPDFFLPFIFAAMHYSRFRQLALAGLLPGLLGVMVYMLFMGVRPVHAPLPQALQPTRIETKTDSQAKYENLIPIGTDRPILYIEQAVQPTDPLSVKLGTSAVILLKYLQKVVVPYPLAFYYGYGAIEPTPLSDWRAVLSVALHALLFLAALFFWHRNRLLSAGLWIYLLSILFFANYFVPIAGMYADRFLLVPSIGFVLVLVSLLLSVFKLEPQKLTLHLPKPPRYAFIALLSFWSVLTFARNFDWKDHLTLMRKDVQYVTNSAQAHNLLALNIMKSTTEGQKTQAELDALRQEALGHFKQSFAIYPNTFNVAYDIGRVYGAMNNSDSMMVYFQKATDLDPDHQLPELSYTLAVYHQETKKYDYAIIQLQKLLKLQNTNLEAYSRLSYIHFTLGQYDQALATNRTAAFNLPTRPEPFINMAYTFQGMKNLDSMTYYFNLAEQRFPGHPVVLQAKRNLNNQ